MYFSSTGHASQRPARSRIPLYLSLAGWLLLGACASNCSKKNTGGPVTERQQDQTISNAAACIDESRLLKHIETIISFGERHAGTPGLEKTRLYIEQTLADAGLSPMRHSFTAHTPHEEIRNVELANIEVNIPAATDRIVVFSGHFDGKIIDEGTFAGANDGGSSTALLLETARCLKKHPIEQSVRIVFFDGEEALKKWSDTDSLYGSKNYVTTILKRQEKDAIAALVNVDMVGDKRLRFNRDVQSAGWIYNIFERKAEMLGYSDLFWGPTGRIGDDHVPFIESGIPAAVLIDLNFGPGWTSNAYWHTPNDNMEHISGHSMKKTGVLIIESIPEIISFESPI